MTTEQAVQIYKDTVAETAAYLDKIHEAHWKARLEAVRGIVAVGTALLAGLVVFLENLLTGLTLLQRTLVLANWILLLVSICAGLVVSWLSITLRSFHPALYNSQIEVEARYSKLDPSTPDLRDRFAAILKEIVDRVTAPIGNADRRANRAAKVCLVTFLLSLFSLVAFAAIRLACGDT